MPTVFQRTTARVQLVGPDLIVRSPTEPSRDRGWHVGPILTCQCVVLIDPGTYRYLDGIMVLDHDKYRSIKGQYSTDVVANRSLEFLGNAIDAGKPFFLGVTPVGPHAELGDSGIFEAPIAATRHENMFPNAKIPRSPSFNPIKVCRITTISSSP